MVTRTVTTTTDRAREPFAAALSSRGGPQGQDIGVVLEETILPALRKGGYDVKTQIGIGTRPGGRRHRIDAVAAKGGKSFLVSLKWQQVGGTTEQKVPYEVISLINALESGVYAKAYLVLGGEGWTLRTFYVQGGLNHYIPFARMIDIVTLEQFIAMANKGRL